jgi:hypothetical protein
MNAFRFNPNESKRVRLVYRVTRVVNISNFVTQHNPDGPVSFFLDRRKVLAALAVALISPNLDLKEVHGFGSMPARGRGGCVHSIPQGLAKLNA